MSGTSIGRPVRIAGVGAVTGYGWGFDRLVAGVGSGTSAGRRQVVDGLDVLASIIPPAPVPDEHPRFEHSARFSVQDALADAGRRGWRPGPLVGVIFCTGIGDIQSSRDSYLRENARPRPSVFPRLLHTSPGSLIAQEHGWTGPNLVVNAACSSGNAALEIARSWLAAGTVTDVIVAGAEMCLIAEIITGFRRMRVLLAEDAPASDCRPFQDGSRRFFLGEAAVALVVTNDVAHPRATYLGGASTHDAFHLVAPEPDGVQLERCYRDAMAAAGVKVDDVGLVKAHGSGTPLNDSVEGAMLDRVFPTTTRVCSYKPLIGHAMAMASLAELAALMAGYESGSLPPRVTDDPANPRLANGGPPPPGPVLCGSVGLGGANAVAVLDISEGTAA